MVQQAAVPAGWAGRTFADLSQHLLASGRGVLLGVLAEEKKMSLEDILADDSSAIDAFIKRKFAESEMDYFEDEKKTLDIRVNPGPAYVLQDTDRLYLVGPTRGGAMSLALGRRRAARTGSAVDQGREFLTSVPLLADLTREELDLVWSTVRRVTSPRGTVIMREGDVGETMFFFAEGEVEVTQKLTLKAGPHGFSQAEKSMVRLRAGAVSFFGDMALFEHEPRSATITAAEDCVLYEISRDDFERISAANPALGYKIMRRIAPVLCQRIRRSNQDVLKLTTALSIALSR